MQTIPTKIATPRGYSVLKSAVINAQKILIEKELTVTPAVPSSFAKNVASFQLWLESPGRYYLPNAWAQRTFGPCDSDIRSVGAALPTHLKFQGSLRPHQVDALGSFRNAGYNGIICLPCGYGKTFTGIAAATTNADDSNTCFMIIVHKEFLADQWTDELKKLVPGIRIGRIQGEKCEIGEDIDVAIAMIQTLCSRNYPSGTFDRFGFAIFDEVHHLGAEHFSQALQRINCRRMLGLTATPKRADGLSKVFEMHLGRIVYEIARRPKDDTVVVEALRYVSDDDAYINVKTNYRGEIVRPDMINRIADYGPRTQEIIDWIIPIMNDPARKLLILSDRREHLATFEHGFRENHITSIGYYVGGMKQKDLDVSAEQRIILGTFAMASEGMNIPTLNMVLLATPKSNIEQSVGRILRLKKEERTVQPIILDVVDAAFVECLGQWARRKKFYKECGYTVQFVNNAGAGAGAVVDTPVTQDVGDKKGIAMFVDDA